MSTMTAGYEAEAGKVRTGIAAPEADDLPRCISCVLPRSTQGLGFSPRGECQLCQTASAARPGGQAREPGNAELGKQIDAIRERGRGRRFDCVIGVSGGRDSSYLLHLLVREHRLRCLAAYYRTPFTSDVTDANVRRMTSQLGVPLVEMAISRDHHRRVARDLVRLWDRRPHQAIANLACAPCKLVNREVFRIARDNGVKSIVFGVNRYEMMQFTAGQSRATGIATVELFSFREQSRATLRTVRRGAGMVLRDRGLWRHLPVGFQAAVMYVGIDSAFLRLRYPDIRTLNYFYYADWTEAACDAALEQLGWRLPPGCHSSWKSDCSFAELKNCMFRQTAGLTYVDTFFSNMVREGVLSRDEALDRVRTNGRVSQERLAETYRILGLQDDERASVPSTRLEAGRDGRRRGGVREV